MMDTILNLGLNDKTVLALAKKTSNPRFAKDSLRIKEVTVEVFNTPSSAAQNILVQILDELKSIRTLLEKE